MKEDWRAHDVLVCIGTGKTVNEHKRLKYKQGEFYFRSDRRCGGCSAEFFPEALVNTVRIAEMCELELPLGQNHLPSTVFPPARQPKLLRQRSHARDSKNEWQSIKSRADRKLTRRL